MKIHNTTVALQEEHSCLIMVTKQR